MQGVFAGAIGVARGSVTGITDQSNEGRAYAILGCVLVDTSLLRRVSINTALDFAGVSVVLQEPSLAEHVVHFTIYSSLELIAVQLRILRKNGLGHSARFHCSSSTLTFCRLWSHL